MPIYQSGGYQANPSSVNKVKEAISDFVAYLKLIRRVHRCTSLGRRKMIQHDPACIHLCG